MQDINFLYLSVCVRYFVYISLSLCLSVSVVWMHMLLFKIYTMWLSGSGGLVGIYVECLSRMKLPLGFLSGLDLRLCEVPTMFFPPHLMPPALGIGWMVGWFVCLPLRICRSLGKLEGYYLIQTICQETYTTFVFRIKELFVSWHRVNEGNQ